MAPKRNNRSGSSNSTVVLPDEDGVLRNYPVVARIEVHVFDDDQSIGSAWLKRGHVSFPGTRTLQIFGTRSSF